MNAARAEQARPPQVAESNRGLKRIRLGLLVNTLRWRAGSSAVFFLVALLAVAAATAGPVYLPAADQSVLEHVIVTSQPVSTGMVVTEHPGQSIGLSMFRKDISVLPRSPSGRRFFLSPIYIAIAGAQILPPPPKAHRRGTKSTSSAASSGAALAVADVVSRSGVCAHLVFIEGRCPVGPRDLALSTRSAAYLHLKLGSSMFLSIGGASYRDSVTGLYRAGSGTAPYWWGANYMQFGTSLNPPPRMDDIFVDAAFLTGFASNVVGLSADVPVNTTGLLSTEIAAFKHGLSQEEVKLGKAGLIAGSGIGSYLDEVSSQQQAMTTIIAVVDLQLLLLVLMVLFGIAGRMAAERRQDLALANLRGLSPRSVWGVALREPFVLMIAATPLGAGLGWLIALATARTQLLGGVPVGFGSLAVAAAIAAMLAALIATAAGSRRLLARTSRSAPVRSTRVGAALSLAGEAFVIALALAAVVQVSAAGIGNRAKSQPLAALAPGLIALACGVIAARVVPLVCRALAAATRYSPRVGLSLALQRVARQSGVIRQSVIVAIALSLALFATAGFCIDKTNRSEQAAFLVGANRVLTVSVPATIDFEQAVRGADPSGSQAMAVQVLSNPQGTLLAVDATRFAHTAAWLQQPGASSSESVARFLNPPVAPAVTVEGAEVDITADLEAQLSPEPSLVLGVFNLQYGSADSVTVGPLRFGRHEYVASLEGYCATACRLDSITASWSGQQGSSDNSASETRIPVELEAMGESTGTASFVPVAAGLNHKGWWRVSQSAPDAVSSVTAGPSGLSIRFNYVAGEVPPSVTPADVPTSLPAVVTNTVASVQQSGPTGSTQYSVTDFGGSPLLINGAIQVAAIPSVGTNAVMVDLDGALRNESLPDDASTKQVWLASSAGPGALIISRLRRDGIKVTSVETSASMELAFDKDGPTLAFGLFLLVGAVSALLATGSMLFAIAAATRQRAIEAVVLRSVGVPRRTLARAMAAELGIVAATGLVAGTVAGVIAAHFSLSSVPEFTGLAAGPTLLFTLPVGWLAAVVAATAVLLAVACAFSMALVSAAATPDKLRISQR